MHEESIEPPTDWPRRLAAWLLELVNGLAGRKRLSASSAAESAALDPEAVEHARAEAEARWAFRMDGARIGCLLVHGLSSTPQSVRWVGEYMAAHGVEVEAVLLPGHGTTPEDLETTTCMDWYGAVREGMQRLRPRCDRLFVCGQSMGGALALRAAAHEPVDGVIGLSAFVYLRDWRVQFVPYIKHVMHWRKSIGNDIANPETRDEMCYDRLSYSTLEQLILLGRTVKADLPLVRVPALVIQSRVDHVVPPDNADYIYDHIASKDKDMVRLEHSYHVIAMDYEREGVAERCVRFMRRVGYAEARRAR